MRDCCQEGTLLAQLALDSRGHFVDGFGEGAHFAGMMAAQSDSSREIPLADLIGDAFQLIEGSGEASCDEGRRKPKDEYRGSQCAEKGQVGCAALATSDDAAEAVPVLAHIEGVTVGTRRSDSVENFTIRGFRRQIRALAARRARCANSLMDSRITFSWDGVALSRDIIA